MFKLYFGQNYLHFDSLIIMTFNDKFRTLIQFMT